MRRTALITLFLSASTAFAGPVAAPGDMGLRHDIQMLADYGVISGPVTTWPISWDALTADLQAATDSNVVYPNAVVRTMQRLIYQANSEAVKRKPRFNGRLSVAEAPNRIRSFSDTPREDGEVSAGFSVRGERFSLDLNATGAYQPVDDEEVRADGSRLSFDFANVTVAASAMDRWWGPGWDGSLILSNNARPIPAITLGRNRTHAFNTKWLSWLGPWDLEAIFGQMEEERVIPNARFFGMRFAFRPVPSLEIGISRTAQWCGDGRPCGWDTFKDLFLGRDNVGDAGTTPENEPGNQLAGFDLRWSNMWFGRPSAFYAQAIAEDEAGGFPSRYMAQLGIETSGYFRNRWSYRWYAEWAGTSCDVIKSEVSYNCAYNHEIYETGYRYNGRVVGHGSENDSSVISTGLVLVNTESTQWQGLIRFGDLNKDGPLDIRNTLTPSPLKISSVDILHSRARGRVGWLDIGVGYERLEDELTGEDFNDARGFISWRSR
jgi:hypothetical protein